MARSGGTAQNQGWQLRKDGLRVFIERSVTSLHDEAGAVNGLLKIGQDVTGRFLSQERLLKEKKRFRSLVEGMPQLVWRSAYEGNWSWANPQWLDYTDQSQKETRGHGYLRAVHPDDYDRTMQA